MFKNVFQSISKSLKKQTDAPVAEKKPAKGAEKQAAAEAKKSSAAPAAAAPAAAPQPVKVEPPKSPEELCGIEGKMSKDQVRERLRLLYRRYNRAASSLNAATRAEAERMMDAIVIVREKHFGEI
jgi:hypothetical protein